jgi:hypothetical protein
MGFDISTSKSGTTEAINCSLAEERGGNIAI